MTPLNRVLSALPTQYYTRGKGKYQAKCPSHDDGSPSLSIAELNDGRILLHCHGGCDVHSVIDSLGLEMSDLYPQKLDHYASIYQFVNGKPKPDLSNVTEDDLVVEIAEQDRAKGKRLNDQDMARYTKALANGGTNRRALA